MARTIFPDRVEVFAYVHPSYADAVVRALKETLELIQRPDNRDVFDLQSVSFLHAPGEVRVVLPNMPEDLDEFLDDDPDVVYDMTKDPG